MAIANPLVGPSYLRDILDPQFHQNNSNVETYVKTELGIKLDKGQYKHTGSFSERILLTCVLLSRRSDL